MEINSVHRCDPRVHLNKHVYLHARVYTYYYIMRTGCDDHERDGPII